MHLNYHFLKQLNVQLNELLSEAKFIEAFSQQKDELMIVFELKDQSYFWVRATLTSSFSCLSFPEEFKRSRKNSVNLFDQIQNENIIEVYQFLNERAFAIQFQSGQSLVFKMYGNRSNIILIDSNGTKTLFKKNLPKDLEIDVLKLDRIIDRSFEEFEVSQNLNTQFPTFGKAVNPWLNAQDYQNLTIERKWSLLMKAEDLMNKPSFYLCKERHKPIFSLLKTPDCEPLPSEPIAAINNYYLHFSRTYFFEIRKEGLLRVLAKKKKQIQNYIVKSEQKLVSLFQSTQPKEIGDIIMANLHAISTGQTEVSLFNFYSNDNISIRLNKRLSPQKNAENYYRKGKNRKVEEAKSKESIESKKKELEKVNLIIKKIETCDSSKVLSNLIKENSLEKTSKKATANVPYKEFQIDGFRIWVGKNAKANDELTLKYSFKEDLWLHAKDVPGSHLLLKYESNRPFNLIVIEKSAEIAAYYSKRKTDSLAPVIYTPVKFVRKRKGSLPGQVVVEKEKVILVPPKKP